MSKQSKNKGRGAKRTLLCIVMVLCLLGAAYLGYLAFSERKDRKQGEDFYKNLSAPSLSTASPTADILSTELPALSADSSLTSIDSTPEPMEAEPTQEPQIGSQFDFDTLRQSFRDIVGWIRLENTVIDYPIMYSGDNDYYLYHLPDRTVSSYGSIMMDMYNAGSFTDDITTLHGHHKKEADVMFSSLDMFEDEAYFLEHSMFRLFTPQGDYDVAVFAAFPTSLSKFVYPIGFLKEKEFNRFVNDAIEKTNYETGVEVSFGDKILILSTCHFNSGGNRYIVMGKILTTP